MKKTILVWLVLLVYSAEAQIFKQDFSTSNFVADYIGSSPNSGQFNDIATNGTNFLTSITNQALRFDRSGNGTLYAFRNILFEKNPRFVQFKLDFEASKHELNKNNIFAVFVGANFTSTSIGSSGNYASRFGISTVDKEGDFRISTIDNIGGAPRTSVFSGKQTLTFIVNNTQEQQTYTAPNGTSETIATGKMDVWIGDTRGINDFSLKNTTSPKGDINGFKIQATSSTGTGVFDFDNIEMTDLLGDSVVAERTQSLKHPHIWVTNKDRSAILANIAQHNWASSLFNQLKNRNASIYTNHALDPKAVLSLIPTIPGDRTTHRTRLNVGAECAFLYYLTQDERYAQIASDILHHYVKMLSIQNPETFQFYSVNFNHLIPPRELFTRVAIIYDFVQPFLAKKTTRVFDLQAEKQVNFNFDTSQKAFEVMANNVVKVGANNSNHPVLELPGALYSVMCMEDDAVRKTFFDKLLDGAENSNQPGINWMLNRFSAEDSLWPESAGYGKFTHALFIQMMDVVDRYQPELNIVENNKDIIESIFIYENFLYPNGATIAYGDIGRTFTDHAHIFRSILKIADRKGYTALKNRAATTLQKIYFEQGGYNPTITNQRLEWNDPLQLFWGVHIGDEISNAGEHNYTTVKATHAGVVMQRNYSDIDNEQNGLMYYTGGGTYVHAHAGGIDMELYGAGYVIGPDYGAAAFESDLHEQYAVSHAAHNTIIVNGSSRRGVSNSGTWNNITDTIALQAVEPKPYENPISQNFSFSTQFLDDNINNVDQQRTNGILRTSKTSGYYIDVFRSKSNTENNFHDYLFHGLGDAVQIKSQDETLLLKNTPERYQNDIGDERKQPGWRWYSNAKTSELTNSEISVRFDVQVTNDFLHVHIPAGEEKEYTTALAPPTKEVKNGYSTKNTQLFVMRKYGEAWNKPFIAIYEPSANSESTIKSTEHIVEHDKIVGVKVTTEVNGQTIIDYIFSNESDKETIQIPSLGIRFVGRFGVVRVQPKLTTTEVSMYIGKGQQLSIMDQNLTADATGKAYKEVVLNKVLSILKNKNQQEAILVSPNPNSGELIINIPKSIENVDVEVLDVNSKLILSVTKNVIDGKIQLSMVDTAKGIYFIKLNLVKPVFIKYIKN